MDTQTIAAATGRAPTDLTIAPSARREIGLCRGDNNWLGYALMLCYLRYPGSPKDSYPIHEAISSSCALKN